MKDSVIRSSLHNQHLRHFYDDGISLVVDEMPICSGLSIADLAVVNGSLHAYEIKGTFDTLARLGKQIENYTKVFDYITVVTTENHLTSVLETIPDFCGVWLMKEGSQGETAKNTIREPKRNVQLDAISICQLLWREETISLLEKFQLDKGIRSKRKWILWETLAVNLPLEELSAEVRSIVKKRVNWKVSRFIATDSAVN